MGLMRSTLDTLIAATLTIAILLVASTALISVASARSAEPASVTLPY